MPVLTRNGASPKFFTFTNSGPRQPVSITAGLTSRLCVRKVELRPKIRPHTPAGNCIANPHGISAVPPGSISPTPDPPIKLYKSNPASPEYTRLGSCAWGLSSWVNSGWRGGEAPREASASVNGHLKYSPLPGYRVTRTCSDGNPASDQDRFTVRLITRVGRPRSSARCSSIEVPTLLSSGYSTQAAWHFDRANWSTCQITGPGAAPAGARKASAGEYTTNPASNSSRRMYSALCGVSVWAAKSTGCAR